MNYSLYVTICILMILYLIIFLFRRNKIGNILVSVRTSEGLFMCWIIMGMICLIIDGYILYLDIIVEHQSIYSLNYTLIFLGILWIINAITSKTFIGSKGISFATLPFYMPLNKISSYTIEDSKLILHRINMADYGIQINISDSDEIIKVMNELKIEMDKN